MAEATIDELRIEVEAESEQAANGLEKLIQKLDRLKAATAGVTENNGLAKIKSQLNKLVKTAQQLQNLSGFDKITQLVNALRSLNGLGSINTERVDTVVASMRRLRNVVEQVNAMPNIDTAKFQQLADALQPFAGANTQGFAEFLKSLQKLPKIAEKLDAMDFGRFADQMQQLAQAVGPVVTEFERMALAFERMPDFVRQFIVNLNAASSAADNASNSNRGLNRTLGNIKVKTAAVVAALSKLIDKLGDCVNTSNQFVENLNLFKVTMGDSADEAYKFAEAVNDAMGIDTSDWVRYQGFFQSIGKGFGIASDKADLMSQNLTQLSYDLSSFYNTSVDEAYNKVVSGISGELEPLRRYGFALDEATLKQLAYEKGITQSIETMTQAQKAQLRYVAILEQAGNIGVLGDMSRTIDTSANQLRILTARLQQFARAVGNMVMPILSGFLPVITAFVQLLTEGAQAIAEFLGFELPRIDLNTSDVTQGYNNITDATNAATEATEKFKGSLAGVDQLNIIGSKTESGTGSGTGLNYDLDIDLPSYDFLNGVESKTKEIFEGIKRAAEELKPYLEGLLGVVIAIGAGAGLTKLLQFLDTAKGLNIMGGIGDFFRGDSGLITKATAGLAGGIANLFLWKKAAKDVTKQTENWGASLGVAIGGTVAIGAVLRAALGPIGYVITGVTLLGGALWGMNEAQEEARRKLGELIVYSNEGGISITALAEGFTDYFDTISSRYSDVVANTSAFESNKKAIGEAAGEIQNVTDKYAALGGEITAEDAEKIKANIETIGSAIKENLGDATQDIVESLRTTFSEFVEELGGDVDDMIGKFYLLEAMGGSAITEYRKQADELVAKIMGGDTSAETMQQLNDVVLKMSAGMSGATEESTTFDRMIKNMDIASIDLESPEAIQAAFDQVNAAAEEARRSVESAWSGQTMELTSMRDFYESMGIDKQFDAMFGEGAFNALFDMSFAAMDKAYQAELDKIDASQAAFTGMIDYELEEKINLAKDEADIIDETMENMLAKIPADKIDEKVRENVGQVIDEQFSEQRAVIASSYEKLKVENTTAFRELGGELMTGMASGATDGAQAFYDAVDKAISGGIDEIEKKYGTITLPIGVEFMFSEKDKWVEKLLAAIKEYAEGNPAGVTSSAPGSVYTTTRGDVLGSTTGIVEGQQGASTTQPMPTELSIVGPMPVVLEVDGDVLAQGQANFNARSVNITNGK